MESRSREARKQTNTNGNDRAGFRFPEPTDNRNHHGKASSITMIKPITTSSKSAEMPSKAARTMMLFISEFLHWSVEPKVCLSRVDVVCGLMRLKWSYKIKRGSPE